MHSVAIAALRQSKTSSPLRTISTRLFSCATRSSREHPNGASREAVDIADLLSRPTWSVASLLPPKELGKEETEVPPQLLHHLLRLSALPPPKDAEEEARMLSTLSSQLHFVKEIQKVDTTGIEPLQSLRDETRAGEHEAELGMDALKDALAQEEVVGKHHKRIRRRRQPIQRQDVPVWDPLGTAGKKVGRFFVVEGGKDR